VKKERKNNATYLAGECSYGKEYIGNSSDKRNSARKEEEREIKERHQVDYTRQGYCYGKEKKSRR
jgi:hypothetical protein